jgi:hypothetical protein
MILVYDGREQCVFVSRTKARQCFDWMVETRGSLHVLMRMAGMRDALRESQGPRHSSACWCFRRRRAFDAPTDPARPMGEWGEIFARKKPVITTQRSRPR